MLSFKDPKNDNTIGKTKRINSKVNRIVENVEGKFKSLLR